MLNKKRFLILLILLSLLIPNSVFAFNEREMEFSNIDQWHKLGYTGKGVKILVSDVGSIIPDSDFINMNQLIDLRGSVIRDVELNEEDTHVQMVVQIIQQIAPDAIIYLHRGGIGTGIDLAIENNVQIVNRSMTTEEEFESDTLNKTFLEAYEKNIFMNGASGNFGSEKIAHYASNPYWFTTGAVRMKPSEDFPKRELYSSYGEGLDFMGFSKLNAYQKLDSKSDKIKLRFSGTSASAPWVSGMVALYNQYYKDINGVFPTIKEVEQFIIDNCIDLENEDYDIYTGHGLFVLPKLEEDKNLVDINQANNTMTRNIGFECMTRTY